MLKNIRISSLRSDWRDLTVYIIITNRAFAQKKYSYRYVIAGW